MTEDEIWELIRRSWQGVPLNDAQKEIVREYLRRRLSEQAIREFETGYRPPPPPPPAPPRPPWWSRPANIARGGVYLVLVYLFVAAVADSFVDPPQIAGGSGPCAIGAGMVPLHVDPSATGPNGALSAAMGELEMLCGNSNLNCSGGACPTCGPDFAVQTVEIKSRILWYTADVTAICQCWCK